MTINPIDAAIGRFLGSLHGSRPQDVTHAVLLAGMSLDDLLQVISGIRRLSAREMQILSEQLGVPVAVFDGDLKQPCGGVDGGTNAEG